MKVIGSEILLLRSLVVGLVSYKPDGKVDIVSLSKFASKEDHFSRYGLEIVIVGRNKSYSRPFVVVLTIDIFLDGFSRRFDWAELNIELNLERHCAVSHYNTDYVRLTFEIIRQFRISVPPGQPSAQPMSYSVLRCIVKNRTKLHA